MTKDVIFQDEIYVSHFISELQQALRQAEQQNTVMDAEMFLYLLATAVNVGVNKPELFVENIKGVLFFLFAENLSGSITLQNWL